jgi:uncharacterized protein
MPGRPPLGSALRHGTTAADLIQTLGLVPHPEEGGYFAETYRAGVLMEASALPAQYNGRRSLATAIYYLLTPATFSALHRLRSDELFHFYLGDPVEMLHLRPDGSAGVTMLGTDFQAGMRPQALVPSGTWQGARLQAGGEFALLGCTVAPGFEYQDYEHGSRSALLARYTAYSRLIEALTPPRS